MPRFNALLTYVRDSGVHMLNLLFVSSRSHVNKKTSLLSGFDVHSREPRHSARDAART